MPEQLRRLAPSFRCATKRERGEDALAADREVMLQPDGRGVAVFDRGRVEIARLSKSAAAEWRGWRLALVEYMRVLAMVGRELVDCDSEEYWN